MEIPKQLQREEFRFIRLKPGEKIPVDKEWSTKNNFGYNDPNLLSHLWSGGNYGVLGGHGGLTIIDCDVEKIEKAVRENLPKTFAVRTGGGGCHFYYLCPDMDVSIRLADPDSDERKIGDIGDVQSYGKQVVGPNSIHPSGNTYRIADDLEIAETTKDDIRKALQKWIASEQKLFAVKEKTDDREGVRFDIDITKVSRSKEH